MLQALDAGMSKEDAAKAGREAHRIAGERWDIDYLDPASDLE